MATQTGTLKAGNQLVIDSIGAPVDYDVSLQGVDVSISKKQIANSQAYGPYEYDATYTVTVISGSPSIYKVQPNGQREYTADTLPDPATLGAGTTVVVDGHLVEVRNGSFALKETTFKPQAICAERLMSTPAVYPGVGKTSQMIRQAPAHFDAVRINVVSAASAGNAWKVTVAPSAAYNELGPVDAAGSNITPTVVTFGSTNRKNPRNPGGGAVTVTSTGASGSGQALIQERIYSDVIKIKSLDRTDHPSRNPLIYVRIFGTDVPVFATNEINATDANPFSAVVPEFYAGMSGADNSITNPGAWAQAGACPAVEIEFFVRGKIVRTIGICGDSTDQGWVDTTAVPQFGGNINGYMRRVVSAMNAAGNPTGYVSCAQVGALTIRHFNDILPVIMSGCLTHLVIRPWTVNNVLIGTTAQVAYDAIAYAELLIQTCIEYGVVPVLLRPFAYGSGETIQQPIIKAFVDSYKESGGRVLDFTSITNLSDRHLKPEYLTVNSSGVVVDQTHPNDLAHQDIADYITAKLHWLFS